MAADDVVRQRRIRFSDARERLIRADKALRHASNAAGGPREVEHVADAHAEIAAAVAIVDEITTTTTTT